MNLFTLPIALACLVAPIAGCVTTADAAPAPVRATVRAGAEICEDVPQFADCFTVGYDLPVIVVTRDSMYTHVRTTGGRYVVDNADVLRAGQ